LRSLIPETPPRKQPPAKTESRSATDGLQLIDTDKIWPNRAQPRERFDPQSLEELAGSMKAQGVLQPIIVRPSDGGTYELVAGERRWRASQIAGLLKIPAVVREVSDDRLLELALIENLQREELNPLEEANAYQTLIDELGLSQQEALRLLNLPPAVQELVQSGDVTAGHAKALASMSNSEAQIELARRIVKDGLTVRAVESLTRKPERARKSRPAPKDERDPNVIAAEEKLQSALGTKVRIFQSKSGVGRLELHFYSPEELSRVYQIVLGAARDN
jgi:ParB family chromosome partitioning protein